MDNDVRDKDSDVRNKDSDVRNIDSDVWDMDRKFLVMYGIWPVLTGLIPDIDFWCLGYSQFSLSTFQTSKVDVRNMDSIVCPCSGHQISMSGIRTVFSVQVPDNHFLIKLMSGIGTVMSGIWTVMSGIRTAMSGTRTKYLSMSRTSRFDVWNMDSDMPNMDRKYGWWPVFPE